MSFQFDSYCKGAPNSFDGVTSSELRASAKNVLHGEFPLPVAVLCEASIAHNREWMRRFCAHFEVALCPHGKTTMSPELFALQIEDGAWGITAATAHHVRIYRSVGVQRILLANQLIAPGDIALVLDELDRSNDFMFLALVDSVEGVERLAAAMRARSTRYKIGLLIEVGAAGGRGGVRTLAEAIAVARAVCERKDCLLLRGVEAFEGIFSSDLAGAAASDGLLNALVECAETLHRANLFAEGEIILTAGGSMLFDLCAQRLPQAALDGRARVILRSGCYIVHDHGSYAAALIRLAERMPEVRLLGEGLRPALEIWGVVQSCPEPGRFIVGIGKRDVGHDVDMPNPVKSFRPSVDDTPVPLNDRYRVVKLYDQHACLEGSAGLLIGDMIAFGVSHPCTTFDKWRALLTVDEAYDVTGAVRTLF